MRKYHQLLLVVVSVASVVALLFYRHEYHRLRYVLEVLNFFGKPAETLQCPVINETSLWQRINGFSSPAPVWVPLGENHYVYSAFWERNEVIAVATGPANNGFFGRNNFLCEIWFEGNNEPTAAKVHASIIENKQKKKVGFLGYLLSCETEKETQFVPEEVTFWRGQDKVPSKVSIPVHYFNDRHVVGAAPLSMAVCVIPEESQRISSSALISFVSYHTLLGVTDFIVYGGSRYSHVVSALQKHGASVSIVPWNFPLSGNGPAELERDCRSRAWPATDNVVVLSLNEFIVPVMHKNLPSMLNDLDAGRKTTARFQLSTYLFCTNYPDDPGAEPNWPMFMHKAYYDPAAKTNPVNIYRPGAVSTKKAVELGKYPISPSIAAIHKFANCDIPPDAVTEAFRYHPQMRVFVSDLMKSGLLSIRVPPRQ